jgi:small conductance mechanosensitive channel
MPRNLISRPSVWLAGLMVIGVLTSASAFAESPQPAEPVARQIELVAGPRTDRAIEARLRAIYAQLEPLQAVEVEVDAGVVRLSGQVRSLEAAQDAEAIAERVEKVVAVSNDIRQEAQISRRLVPVFERMRAQVSGWLDYLPLVLIAVASVALAWVVSRLLARRSRRHSEPQSFGWMITEQLVRAGILSIGVAIALEVLGARGLLGAMLGTAGVIGIVLGVAFKNIGETYIASVLLSIRRPFDPLDFVRIDEVEGSVVRLTSRATVLLTVDGHYVSIPNAKVFGATVVNLTRNPQRRFAFELGVGVDAELRHVQALAVATVASVPGVLSEPEPSCLIERFGDAEIVIGVAGWIDQRESDWYKVSSEAMRMIKAAFDQAGIDMPEPTLRVRTATFEPRAEAAVSRAEPQIDVSPDDHIDRTVEQERRARPRDDLMRNSGRME